MKGERELKSKKFEARKYYVHAAFFLLLALSYLAVKYFFDEKTQIVGFVSTSGFIALSLVIFILIIPLLAKYNNSNLTRFLMAERRWIGIYTFVFAAIHWFLVFNFFFGWDISKLLNHPNKLYLSMGSLALLLLFLMTVTSNNYSVRKLGKNWKRLHYIIYPALILILIHSFNIGLVYMKNLWVKVLIVAIVLVTLILKFYKRKK